MDLIVVATGGGFDFDDIEHFIGTALVDPDNPLPTNPNGVAKLSATLATIALTPEPRPVPPLPETSRKISGKTFVFDPNPLQLATLRLNFTNAEEGSILVTFADNQSPRSGRVGLDGVYRMSPGRNNFPAGYRGYWTDNQTFVVEVEEIANRDAFTVSQRFVDDQVMVEAKERTHESVMTSGERLQNQRNHS